MKEQWKKIVIDGNSTVYSVSNYGRVRNDKKMTYLEGYVANNGYRMVHLRYRLDKMCSVHRLVAKAFMPREDMDILQINHIDGNKQNNHIDNLEWCTALDNMRHSFRMGLQKNKSEKCYQYDLEGNFIAEYENASEAANVTGYDIGCILRCMKEQASKNNDYMFKSYKKHKIDPWYNPRLKAVYVYTLDGTFIQRFDSYHDCAECFGINQSTVSRCIKNKKGIFHEFIFSQIPIIV